MNYNFCSQAQKLSSSSISTFIYTSKKTSKKEEKRKKNTEIKNLQVIVPEVGVITALVSPLRAAALGAICAWAVGMFCICDR